MRAQTLAVDKAVERRAERAKRALVGGREMRAEASVGEREQRNGELFRGAVVVIGLEVQREAQGGARGVVLAAEARAQAVRLDETLRDLERGVGRAEERIELTGSGEMVLSPTCPACFHDYGDSDEQLCPDCGSSRPMVQA